MPGFFVSDVYVPDRHSGGVMFHVELTFGVDSWINVIDEDNSSSAGPCEVGRTGSL